MQSVVVGNAFSEHLVPSLQQHTAPRATGMPHESLPLPLPLLWASRDHIEVRATRDPGRRLARWPYAGGHMWQAQIQQLQQEAQSVQPVQQVQHVQHAQQVQQAQRPQPEQTRDLAPAAEVTAPVPNATRCVCSAACKGPSTASASASFRSSTCLEAIPACRESALRRGPQSLAVLAQNSVYRLQDILAQRGLDWRADSIAILCEARYRGTLLRTALVQSSLLDGVPLVRMGANAIEAALASRAEGGKPGHALLVGRSGPSNLTLGAPETLFASFVRHMAARHAAAECEVAASDELIIVMRLGDEAPKSAFGWMVRADRYMASPRGKAAGLRRAVVCAVLHYDADSERGGVRYNQHTERKDATAFVLVDELRRHLKRKHKLHVRVRSNPDVDADICFYVFSPHVVGVTRFHQLGPPEANASEGRAFGLDPGPGRPGLFALAERIRDELNLTNHMSRWPSSCGFRTECTQNYTADAVMASAAAWTNGSVATSGELAAQREAAERRCSSLVKSVLEAGGGSWADMACLKTHGYHERYRAWDAFINVSLPRGHSYFLPHPHVAADATILEHLRRLLRRCYDPPRCSRTRYLSVADLGAGVGQYGHALLSRDPRYVWRGYDAAGNVESLTGGFVRYADLSRPVSLPRADWVVSLEVGQHIHPEHEMAYVRNLHVHARCGILLSWAPPRKWGAGHVNLHRTDYLVRVFTSLGYNYNANLSVELRAGRPTASAASASSETSLAMSTSTSSPRSPRTSSVMPHVRVLVDYQGKPCQEVVGMPTRCRHQHMGVRNESRAWSWLRDVLVFERRDEQGCGGVDEEEEPGPPFLRRVCLRWPESPACRGG